MILMHFTTILLEWENVIPYNPPSGYSIIKENRHIFQCWLIFKEGYDQLTLNYLPYVELVRYLFMILNWSIVRINIIHFLDVIHFLLTNVFSIVMNKNYHTITYNFVSWLLMLHVPMASIISFVSLKLNCATFF